MLARLFTMAIENGGPMSQRVIAPIRHQTSRALLPHVRKKATQAVLIPSLPDSTPAKVPYRQSTQPPLPPITYSDPKSNALQHYNKLQAAQISETYSRFIGGVYTAVGGIFTSCCRVISSTISPLFKTPT